MSVITTTKSATARINGSKSHGPTTAAGQTRSSRNALRHGLSAGAAPTLAPVSPVLPTESAADYQTLLHSYLAEFTPEGLLETELVETMATARWRLRRISTIETTLLAMEMDRLAIFIDRVFEDRPRDPTPNDRLAWTFNNMSAKPSLNLLLRYEATLNRSYARALKQLQQLQSLPNRELPNEPKAAPTPLEPETSTAPHNSPASVSHPLLDDRHQQGVASPAEAEEMCT